MSKICLYNSDNVKVAPAYEIEDDKVYTNGTVAYTIVGNNVYQGPFGGGMLACTFDEQHVYINAQPAYTVDGDKIYKGPFAGGIIAWTIVKE